MKKHACFTPTLKKKIGLQRGALEIDIPTSRGKFYECLLYKMLFRSRRNIFLEIKNHWTHEAQFFKTDKFGKKGFPQKFWHSDFHHIFVASEFFNIIFVIFFTRTLIPFQNFFTNFRIEIWRIWGHFCVLREMIISLRIPGKHG